MQTTYDPLLDEDVESQSSIWLKRLAFILLGLLVLAALGYSIKKLMSGGDSHPKKKITTIALKDLPPPPPPPPPKEQPKDQPKDQPKEVKELQQPKPAEAPPSEVLKMDGPAGDGPSAFQAGAVTKDFEKGNPSTTIGGDGGAKYNWYAGLLRSQIQETLEKDKTLKESQYKLIVSVWLRTNGDIEKLEWSGNEAEPEMQQAVKAALDSMPAMREAPPEGMPQPIKLRITARKMG